jgi:hypothetical protein
MAYFMFLGFTNSQGSTTIMKSRPSGFFVYYMFKIVKYEHNVKYYLIKPKYLHHFSVSELWNDGCKYGHAILDCKISKNCN